MWKSKAVTQLLSPLPEEQVIQFDIDVVNKDMALLIKLYVAINRSEIISSNRNLVINSIYYRSIVIEYRSAHTLVLFCKVYIFLKPKLARLNLQFHYSFAESMFNLLWREHPTRVTLEKHKILNQIADYCNIGERNDMK